MRAKLEYIFSYLDNNAIQYFLLRPIDLNNHIEDIDLIIPKQDFMKLIKVLDKDSKKVHFKYSNANESIQLFVNDILLDIKFNICFLPRKSLILNDSFPYCSVVIKENRYIYPSIDEDILFTFWAYHLLLDKVDPSLSSTYVMFNNCFGSTWEALIKSNFFIKWTNLIFRANSAQALQLVALFFSNKTNIVNKINNKKLQKLAIKSNSLGFKFYFDKYYFKILRLSGFIKRKRSLQEINIK